MARLLMIADTLRPDDVMAIFYRTAVPETELPPGVRVCRVQYETLRQAVQEVRCIRLYLVMDTRLGEETDRSPAHRQGWKSPA